MNLIRNGSYPEVRRMRQKRYRKPPLDDDDRSFWMTPFWHIVGIEPYRVCIIFGFRKKNPIMLIQDEKGVDDIAVFSISDSPVRIWGRAFDREQCVVRFISAYQKVLIDHWNGDNDSADLCRIIKERELSPINIFCKKFKKLDNEEI